MHEYTIVRVDELLRIFPDNKDKIDHILDTFSCNNNKDVDRFLKERAVLFDKQGISKTYLVFAKHQDVTVMVGYFTLTSKSFVVKKNGKLSKTFLKRISKFGQYYGDVNQYVVSAPLIAQVGKNDKFRGLISGDVLLAYACEIVRKAQSLIGGRIVYLECEDKAGLLDFYRSNGFVDFGKREIEADERVTTNGKAFIQLLKYLH